MTACLEHSVSNTRSPSSAPSSQRRHPQQACSMRIEEPRHTIMVIKFYPACGYCLCSDRRVAMAMTLYKTTQGVNAGQESAWPGCHWTKDKEPSWSRRRQGKRQQKRQQGHAFSTCAVCPVRACLSGHFANGAYSVLLHSRIFSFYHHVFLIVIVALCLCARLFDLLFALLFLLWRRWR